MRYLATKETFRSRCDRSHLKKYWLVYSLLRSFTCTSFVARNPLTFVLKVTCRTFDSAAAFTLVVRPHSCTASFRYLGCGSAASNKYSRESNHQKSENRILQRPFRLQPFSQKMEVVFRFLSRTRKTRCQLSLTILTYVGRSLNPEKGPQKLWHDRTALFSANIWVNGCGVVGQTLSRQFLTCRNSDQYNPWRCTHLCPVSLNRMCYTICD